MNALLIVWVGSHLTYIANTATFGCTSIEALSELQNIRHDEKAFNTRLIEQVFNGECLEIPKGEVVNGVLDANHELILLVGRDVAPPGFLAPKDDFGEQPGASP